MPTKIKPENLTFQKAYKFVYSEDATVQFSRNEIMSFTQVYNFLLGYWSMMNSGFQSAKTIYPPLMKKLENPTVSEMDEVAIWLLYGLPIEDFFERLLSLIVEHKNTSLIFSDYVFLLYVSYQENNFADKLNEIPFYLLRQTLEPVAEANVKIWMEV
jgi:hypothetical protein